MNKNKLLILKEKRFRIFLFSFLVSLIAWLIINLSKTYSKTIAVSLSFDNVEKNELVDIKDSLIKVKVQGTGFSLISDDLEDLNFTIDVNKHHKRWIWQVNQYRFNDLMPKNIEVVNVEPDTVYFEVSSLIEKKVPVVAQIKVEPQLGYDITATKIQPDSVIIYGNDRIIDSILYVKTKELLFEDVSKPVTGEIDFLEEYSRIKTSQRKIAYNFNVERFTQGDFLVPIQLKNVPDEKKVNIFPQQIHVQFQAPLSTFSDYQPENFQISVDFNEIDGTNTLPIHLDYVPKGVKNTRILKKTVTYLLIEK